MIRDPFSNIGMRHRGFCSKLEPEQCGQIYATPDGGKTWNPGATYTYVPSGNRKYGYIDSVWDECHPGPPYRTGGPFNKFSWYDTVSAQARGTYAGGLYKYVGGFVPSFGPLQCTGFVPLQLEQEYQTGNSSLHSTYADPLPYGATGWRKARPGNPTAGLGVFIGELRDVPHMLRTTAKGFRDLWKSLGGNRKVFGPKKVADHWLNHQFGWMPFVNDLRKFYKTWKNVDGALDYIRSANGQWIRRACSIKDDHTSKIQQSSKSIGAHWPTLPTSMYQSAMGSYELSYEYDCNVWFEGAFRYYIPPMKVNKVSWSRGAKAELFGAKPNPAMLWELIPWSWLGDWCSNAGDVISNMDTGYAENLAAKYAYVMKKSEWRIRLDSICNFKSGSSHLVWDYPVNWKTRVSGSPFGFSLSPLDFSARQWSILAALGISRY